jgi:hypothetical protein
VLARLPLLDGRSANQLRDRLKTRFLRGFPMVSGAELSRWLLAVYESAH